jgi:hypothetical protein
LTDDRLAYSTAIDALSRDPLVLAEIQAALPALEAAAAPCGPKAVVALLTPLVSLYGVPDKSSGEWRAFWGYYVEALSDLPMKALKAGIADYVAKADSEFFPKPGPLKALCDRHAAGERMAANRARRALDEWPRRLREYERNNWWPDDWGPKPGKPGYRGPELQEAA